MYFLLTVLDILLYPTIEFHRSFGVEQTARSSHHTSNTSHVTRHTSHVTRHTLPKYVTHHTNFGSSMTKEMKQKNDEGAPPLYECVPVNWLWLPAPLRKVLGHAIVIVFSLSFLSVPISFIFLTPYMLRNYPIVCGVYLSSMIMSMLVPLKEWEYARVLCQLTYELYGTTCNLSPKDVEDRISMGQKGQYIIGMREYPVTLWRSSNLLMQCIIMFLDPHGIVPIQALLWCAYCDQYMSDGKERSSV